MLLVFWCMEIEKRDVPTAFGMSLFSVDTELILFKGGSLCDRENGT